MSIETALSGDEKRIPFRFTVPDAFHELDLAESSEDRARRTFERFRAAYPGASDDQRAHIVANQELALNGLVAQGAVYAAVVVARSYAHPEQLSFAQFSVLVQAADLRGDRPAGVLAAGMRSADSPRQVSVVDFPAGQAVVVGEEVSLSRTMTVTGEPKQHTHRMRQAQVIFARPEHGKLVTLGLVSESIADWSSYAAILNNVARSVSFSDVDAPSIVDRLTSGG